MRFKLVFVTLVLTVVSLSGVREGISQVTSQSDAAVEQAKTSPVKIEDFNWIAGNWKGEAMGGSFEESWSPASGGALMGMFKFVSKGKIKFYELLTIVPKNDSDGNPSFTLRLKHFDSGLKGWEEKDDSVEFPLVSVSPTEAKFDGLVFTKIGPDRMDIVVQTQQGEKTQELKFECHRSQSNSQAAAAIPTNDADSGLAITRILEIDSVLAKQRDNLPKSHPITVAVESYVLGLKELDFTDCPAEFSEPFHRHRDAWSDSVEFFAQHGQLRGEMHEAINKIRQIGPEVAAELDSKLLPVMKTWQEVEKAAKKFQVK